MIIFGTNSTLFELYSTCTAESYSNNSKQTPFWAVGLRTVQRRHREVLEPFVRPYLTIHPSLADKTPSEYDPFLEMPLSSLSNGESPVFLVGHRPPRHIRLADGTIVPAPINKDDGSIDHASIPAGSELVRPVIGEANGAVVIKFFSHLQTKRSQNTEIAAHMMFNAIANSKEMRINGTAPKESAMFVYRHTPSLLAHGELYNRAHSDIRDMAPFSEPDGWPYIVMPFIQGQDMDETFPSETSSLPLTELTDSARFLGTYLRHLHQFEVSVAPKSSMNPLYDHGWRGFERWLIKQRRILIGELHFDPDSLPQHMRYDLDDYLPRDVRTLIDWYRSTYGMDQPRLLHNDLNEEHLLLLDGKPYAVIDFGDCRMGDPQYEWVAVFISALRCRKHLLQVALMAYYQVDTFEALTEKVGGWKRFTYTMMCYSLLHEQDSMRSAYNRRPELKDIRELGILADELWNLSIPMPQRYQPTN